MKSKIIFIALVCSLVAHGFEREQKEEPLRSIHMKRQASKPLKSIRREVPAPNKMQDNKYFTKSVEFHLDPPSLPVPTLPNSELESDNLVLERLNKSYDYKNLIKRIYDDAEKMGIREIAGVKRDEANELVSLMRKTREYAQPVDIGNYEIVRAADRITIGRLLFTNYVFGRSNHEGFLEVQFHLMSDYKDKGLGYESLGCLIKDLINPKIGKTCTFMRSVLMPKHQGNGEQDGCLTNILRGVYAKCCLFYANILDSHKTIATYFKAGFGVKLWNGDVMLSYPPEAYPSGPSLTQDEVLALLRISKLMQDCRAIKVTKQKAASKTPGVVFEEPTINLKEILSNRATYTKQIGALQKQYLLLLGTSERITFLSALNILHCEFGITQEELTKVVSIEKAQNMDRILDKDAMVPNGHYFLRSFIPFRLHLSLSDEREESD